MFYKLTLISIILILCLSMNSFAAEYIEIQNSNKYTICRFEDHDETWAYFQLDNIHDIGRENGSSGFNDTSSSDIYRSAYTFDLSGLDDDVTITSVILYMSCGNYNNFSSMKIRFYSGDPLDHNWDEIWSNINSGTVYYNSVDFGWYGDLDSNDALEDSVKQALSNGIFTLGILSNAESTNNTWQNNIQLTLKINYIDKYDITVKNSFGGGSYKMNDTTYSHNHTHRLSQDVSYSFENWHQNYSGTDYIFQNKWTNVDTGQVYNGNPVSISFTSDATLRAEFKKEIHIIVKNRGNGGQVKVDDTTYTSGAEFDFLQYSQHDFEAWEQSFDGYMRRFKPNRPKWITPDGNFNTAIVNDHSVEGAGIWEAQLYKEFNISVDNELLDGGSGGDIIINSNTVTSPHLEYVLEEEDITVEAVPNQTIEINGNNIQHHFLNYADRGVINWGNQIPFPELERTYSPQDHENIDLLYKANVHTNAPQETDTKNQRQLLNLGDTWIMIYESNGDIWLTASDDAGYTWCKEQRMNIRQGHGYNPSLSNIFSFGSSSYDYYTITWLEENTSQEIELHLQTMRAAGDWLFYGWKGGDYYGRVDGVNHRIFDWNGYGYLRSTARPVLRIDLSGTDIIMTVAGGVEESGIHMSHIKFEGNGYNSVDDLDEATVIKYGFNPSPPAGYLGFCRRVTTSTKHKYPVLINTPPSYGGAVKNYIYFGEDNSYLPKLKIHDITTNTTGTISIPSEFSGIFALQGGSSPGNATVALCVRTSARIGGPNVVVFERPSYGGYPQFKTVYRGYDHPTIMVEQQTGFNSSGCTHTVMMQGNDENWYWSDGGEIDYLDSEIAGIFARAKVSSNDKEVIVVREGEVPVIIEKLGGEKKLAKEILSTTDIRYYQYWEDTKSKLNLSVLDFNGATVQLFDSVKSSNKITAIKLLESGKNGFIVQQPDSLLSNIGVKLLSGNNTIRTISPTIWTTLTTSSLTGVQPLDIILFESVAGTKVLWSFAELSFKGCTFRKDTGDLTEDCNDENSKIISAFPNPFNPNTNFTFNLKNSGKINLSIYDVRGRLVKNLVNSFKSAGKYSVRFDGHHLSSGIYFYRFETDNFVKINKLMLIK